MGELRVKQLNIILMCMKNEKGRENHLGDYSGGSNSEHSNTNQIHLKTKRFEGPFSNGSVRNHSYEPTIRKPNPFENQTF